MRLTVFFNILCVKSRVVAIEFTHGLAGTSEIRAWLDRINFLTNPA